MVLKNYHKNRCHTDGCKNSGENAVLIQVKENKIIIQVCEMCKELINGNNTKSKNSSSDCNYIPMLDSITVISMTLENMEKRFSTVMSNEMKIPINRMRRSIDNIIDHVIEHSQEKNNNNSEMIKIENLDEIT